jgi:hypothetical protein
MRIVNSLFPIVYNSDESIVSIIRYIKLITLAGLCVKGSRNV